MRAARSNKKQAVTPPSPASDSPSGNNKWRRCRAPPLTSQDPEGGHEIHDKIEQLLKSTDDCCGTLTKALYGELIHRTARFYCQSWKRDKFEIHHLNRVFNIESAVKSAIANVCPVKLRRSLIPDDFKEKVTPILAKAFNIPADKLRPGSKAWLNKKRALEDYTVEEVTTYDQLRHQWIVALKKEMFDPLTGKPYLREGIINALSHLCMLSEWRS